MLKKVLVEPEKLFLSHLSTAISNRYLAPQKLAFSSQLIVSTISSRKIIAIANRYALQNLASSSQLIMSTVFSRRATAILKRYLALQRLAFSSQLIVSTVSSRKIIAIANRYTGLQFSVDRVHRLLKKGNCNLETVSRSAEAGLQFPMETEPGLPPK